MLVSACLIVVFALIQAEGASTSVEPAPTATTGPAASRVEGVLVEEVQARDSEVLPHFCCFKYL